MLETIARQLDPDSPPSELFVLDRLGRLIRQTSEEIDQLPLDGVSKQHIKALVNPFLTLVSLQHAHITIKQAEGQILKPESLQGLINVHAATAGFFAKPVVPKEASDLANELELLRTDLGSFSLPDRLKKAVINRIDQIIILLKNYEIFDSEDLQEEFEALVGTMLVASDQKSADASAFDAILNIAGKGLQFLKTLDGGLGTSIEIGKKAKKLSEFFTDNGDD
ncbi:MAG: hypothetical protein QNJ09_03470 [Paracoccaceae bacterium]|nr:hypothetical protein [Paracoccaceae bacterium]